MLSKNNYKERLRQMEQKTERFSIRKLTIGAASVLIGLSFLGFNSHTAKADTTSSNEDITTKGNETTVENTVKESNSTATGLKFTDAAKNNEDSDSQTTNSTTGSEATANVDKASTNNEITNSKKDAAEKVAKNNKVLANTSSTASATHANGTGGYTENGIFVPALTEPEASEFWDQFNQIVKPVSKEDLAKLGLDKDTYYESATNHTKWHAVGWASLSNSSTGDTVNLGKFMYHNPDGTIATVFQKDSWLAYDMTAAMLNTDDLSDYRYHQIVYLVPITSDTSTIYVNKGVALSYDDIRRALASNTENINGLVSGDWVTGDQVQGVKTVDVNKVGLQEGAVRLNYVNGTEISASINVDVVDLQGQTTYVNVNSPLPDADSVISGQPEGSKDIKWVTTPDLSQTGVSTGTVQVTYPDNSTGTANVTFNVEDPQGKNITIHVGQDVTPDDVVVPNTYPTDSTITWVTKPNTDVPGKQDISVVVTYPNGVSSHEVPAVITVIAPKGQDITTPNGEVPSAEKGISNVPDMPAGTKYEWKTTPDVTTPGNKPAVVVVTFPDGNKVDVPITVTVEEPVPDNNGGESTPGEPVVTPENPVAPLPEEPETPNDNNDTPGEPTTDDETVAPHPTETPDTNDETTPSQPTEVKNDNGETAPVHAAVVATSNKHAQVVNNNQKKENTLPQTGAKAGVAGMLGLMIASVGAILGLAVDKKRKN